MPNELRITKKVGLSRYLDRAYEILNDDKLDHTVVIRAFTFAADHAVRLVELIKRKVKGVHQITKISSFSFDEEYEPLEEGLDHLKFSKIVSMIEITLSLNQLDEHDIGYQGPIPEDQVEDYKKRAS